MSRLDSIPGEPSRYRGRRRMPKPGVHRYRMPAGLRTSMGVSAAALVTLTLTGSYLLTALRPGGHLLPQRNLPGIERQVPTVQDSAIEQFGTAPPAASRGRLRTQTPAPVLSREPDPAAAADRSSSPPAAATPTPGGGTKAEGPMPMPSTACPPPLPPKPKKSKKAAAAEVSAGPDGVTVKLFILKPAPTASASP